MFSISGSKAVTGNGYNDKVAMSVSELTSRLIDGTAQKDISTFDTIWNIIKGFFNETKKFFTGANQDTVCGAFCDIFNKGVDEEDRALAVLTFMSSFTTESKQPLFWQAFDDYQPTFLVGMQLPKCIYHSPIMGFDALAKAYNKLAYGWLGDKSKELAKSLYKNTNDTNNANDPKVYENLTTFFADNAHNKENVSSFVALIKNITDKSLFNSIMDRYVKKVISSKIHSTESNNTLVNNVKNYIYTGIYWIDLLTPTESLEDFVDVPFPCEENINYSLAKVFIDIITTSEDPKPALEYIKEKLFFIYEDKEGLLSAFKHITGNRNNQLLYQQYKRDALVIDLVTDLGNYLGNYLVAD